MPEGMLGRLPLTAVRGPRDALDDLLASSEGEAVLGELKKFVKKQPCWVPVAAAEIAPSAPAIIKPPVSTIIKPPRPFDPTIFGQGRTIWLGPKNGSGLEGEEERDPRSFELPKLDYSLIELEVCLRHRESYTTGEVRIERLIAEKADHIRLDPSFALFFRDHSEMYPDAWKGKTIFWDGLTLRGPDGHRYAVDSIWVDGRVVLGDRWLGGHRRADGPSALLASKHLISAPSA